MEQRIAPAVPYLLNVTNNTRFVHNVQLFNSRYYVDGIRVISPIPTIEVKEIYYQVGFHPCTILPVRCHVTRHDKDDTLHGGRWEESAFLERLEPWILTKDASGMNISIPIELNLSNQRKQKNIADAKTKFGIDSLTYFCFYAYPGITYNFYFYPAKP